MRSFCVSCASVLFLLGLGSGISCSAVRASDELAAGEFEFIYGGAITQLPPGAKARVWLPVATSDYDQDVKKLRIELPGEYQQTKERKYGGSLLFSVAKANEQGEIPFEIAYSVRRREVRMSRAAKANPKSTAMFLEPSSNVPNDPQLQTSVLGEIQLPRDAAPLTIARILYDAVDVRMKYDKPLGGLWGRGDAVWACNSGFGNCTDFHSLFISCCRTAGVPSRFEMGFPIPAGSEGIVGGYHCWARFLASGRWIPVDISEADKQPVLKDYYFGNLTPDRVLFSEGRDLSLMPPPAATTVNYLIYPYVEVDGKPHTALRKAFRFRRLP